MDVKEGYIVRLKAYNPDDHAEHLGYFLEDKGKYDHPVLVVRAQRGSKEAHVCLLTSKPNNEYSSSFYDYNFAIYPRRSPDDSVPQSHLEDNVRLKKESLVDPRKLYLVHRSMLGPYMRGEDSNYCRLTKESYADVQRELCGLTPVEALQRCDKLSEELRSSRTDEQRLNDEVDRLTGVEAENKTLRESLDKIEAEVKGLRLIEGEAARLRRLYPGELGLRTLEDFISWNHREYGSESAVGKEKPAESDKAQSRVDGRRRSGRSTNESMDPADSKESQPVVQAAPSKSSGFGSMGSFFDWQG